MKLREIRLSSGLTQKELAKRMGTTQQSVARWERGETSLKPDVLRELSYTLNCTPEDILDWSPEKRLRSPFPETDWSSAYGTLEITVSSGTTDAFPISRDGLSLLEQQLATDTPLEDRKNQKWVYTFTLDNKIIAINPTNVTRIKLYSDDVRAMPRHYPKSVYSALLDSTFINHPKEAHDACEEIKEALGDEETLCVTTHLKALFADGTTEVCYIDEDVAEELDEFIYEMPDGNANILLRSHSETDYATSLINLSKVGFLHFPREHQEKLTGLDH